MLKIYFATEQALINDFLAERGNKWRLLWCFPGAAPNILRRLHTNKYWAYYFWPENHVFVLALASVQISAIGISLKR